MSRREEKEDLGTIILSLSSSRQRRKQCVNEKKNRFCKADQKEKTTNLLIYKKVLVG
jgi:hypothetical protein